MQALALCVSQRDALRACGDIPVHIDVVHVGPDGGRGNVQTLLVGQVVGLEGKEPRPVADKDLNRRLPPCLKGNALIQVPGDAPRTDEGQSLT